jgi:hypothetical protein
MQPLIPDIQTDIPVPSKTSRAIPEFNPQVELKVRATTIKHISDLTGQPVAPTADQQVKAEELAHSMLKNPTMRPEYSKYANETMLYLAGMVAQSNVQLVDELSELKMYVVNKLIYEVEHANDSKSRIAALSKLGEVDGVDAFKKRTETTITVKPIEEVEKELLTILENVEYAVLGENDAPEMLETAYEGVYEGNEAQNEVQNEESEVYNG